jgi:hypothetical protein
VVVFAPGTEPHTLGPEIKRFACPAFSKEGIIGASALVPRPIPDAISHAAGTDL